MRAEENLSKMRSKTAQFEFCVLHLKMQHQRLSHEVGQMVSGMSADMQSVERRVSSRVIGFLAEDRASTMVRGGR